MAAAAAGEEKVFVALPAEFKAGQSTLAWALSHFAGGGATVVIAHVHVPPQMIPVMGVKFHASKLSPEQVSLFRRIEREKVNQQLDDYLRQCRRMKVKCEKLVFEDEDVVAGLVELIVVYGVTKLVISAAADRQYSRKMDKPMSRTATEIMQRADPSCKIWFVCKGQLICTRHKELEIIPPATPLLPASDHHTLELSPVQEEDEVEAELGFYDVLKEACIAAEDLMKRASSESSRRQKAHDELASAIQKAKEYQELYLEEVTKRKELEEALSRANREIMQLKQTNQPFKVQLDSSTDELQEEMTEILITGRGIIDMDADFKTARQLMEPQKVHAQVQHELDGDDNGATELQALLDQGKLESFSPSSVIHSPYAEDFIPSYFLCPILQEVTRDPHVAADGFTYEGDAIRGWLRGGREVSPVTRQRLAHRELVPNLALRAVIRDYVMRRQRRSSVDSISFAAAGL
ncbi:hypothetical protein ACP70R_020918 [Stipagrostis hirtigluma subsp. patula]